MSYRCVKELKVDAHTIPVGAIIERDVDDDKAFITFAIGDYHYAVYHDTFRKHFEEVE